MMDEKITKQISDAIDDGSGSPDEALQTLMDDDEEVANAFEDINALERQLRSWGHEEPPRQYWKGFSGRITSRLDSTEPDEVDHLAPPAPDEDSELALMESLEESSDEGESEGAGLGALAALAGRSTLPPAKNFEEEDGEDDDEAVLDLGALIAGDSEDKEDKSSRDDKEGSKAKSKKNRDAQAPARTSSGTPAPAAPSKAAAPPQKQSSSLYYVVGLLFVALLVVGYIAFGTDRDSPTTMDSQGEHRAVAVAPAATQPSENTAREPEEETQESESTTEPEEVEEQGSEEEGQEELEASDSSPRSSRPRSRRKASSSEPSETENATTKAPSAPPRPAKTTPTQPAKSSGGASNDLDALLAGATAPVRASKTKSGSAGDAVQAAVGSGESGSSLPPQPSRSQVRRAMGSVAGQVMACRSLVESQTRVNATVTVGSSGSIQSASVSGGTPAVQQCVKRAVQRARFPRFSQPTFAVTYPFVLSPPE